jgi:DUF971 family protein
VEGESKVNQFYIYIQQIDQENGQTFSIRWSDQLVQKFLLGHLQQNCPCAGCAAKKNGEQAIEVHPSVIATRIASVGRYAIKIHFSSGCSAGIYDYELLRKIGIPISGEKK